MNEEEQRLKEHTEGKNWKKFGPYLSERQWGTVREDYSEFGSAWEFFPHDHARSRVYRWGEDGIAGWSDDQQLICLSLSLWNGQDPILKERLFGLTGNEGNHSEDVKEIYYYLDSTPTHSYMKMLYRYPHKAFPYQQLVEENKGRNHLDKEFELVDTGIFNDNAFFDVVVEYAKADPEDILISYTIYNKGENEASIHLLPTVLFRNTWLYGETYRPTLVAVEGGIKISHKDVGEYYLYAQGENQILFCNNESNAERHFGMNPSDFYKDGINNYIIHHDKEAINYKSGTKAAFYFQLQIAGKQSKTVRLRMTKNANPPDWLGFDLIIKKRAEECESFYNQIYKKTNSKSCQNIQRQAFSGMMWGKQYYNFHLEHWLNGDPGQKSPPPSRKVRRNHDWMHMDNHDIISMPDKWEYPWYAAWDSAFHCIPIAHIDLEFAQEQLLLFMNERYMNEAGQIPAYEWAFGDVNPPVHGLGSRKVYEIGKNAGKKDIGFLKKAMIGLKKNFEWWLKEQVFKGKLIFGGGFLGLDNVSAFNRGMKLPDGDVLEQVDGTSWMALFALDMMYITLEIGEKDCEETAMYYADIFLKIASDLNAEYGLWSEKDGFYYDTLCHANGKREFVNVRNIVGLMPLIACSTFSDLSDSFKTKLNQKTKLSDYHKYVTSSDDGKILFSAVPKERFDKLISLLTDESEFFSNHGTRSLSKHYDQNPLYFELGDKWNPIEYKPAESITTDFGENSNWRGPIWFPVNYVLVEALFRYHDYYQDKKKLPVSFSKSEVTYGEIGNEIIHKMSKLFDVNSEKNDGETYYTFYEYFNPETGEGFGASHQTGWTGLIADLIFRLNNK